MTAIITSIEGISTLEVATVNHFIDILNNGITNFNIAFGILVLLFTNFMVLRYAPIINYNKRINNAERKAFRKRGIVITWILSTVVMMALMIDSQSKSVLPVIIGLLVVSVSMLVDTHEIVLSILNDDQLVIMGRDLYKFHQKHNFTAIPYSTQANGFFCGTYNWLINNYSLNKNSREKIYYGKTALELYYNDYNIKLLGDIVELSSELHLSQTQIILLYLLHSPFQTLPIVGCRTIEQLRDSCKASDFFDEPDTSQVSRLINKFNLIRKNCC